VVAEPLEASEQSGSVLAVSERCRPRETKVPKKVNGFFRLNHVIVVSKQPV
jgi:hypothetical protein